MKLSFHLVTLWGLEIGEKTVVFRISGSHALSAKAFNLPSPPRYVADLEGFWAIKLPKVPTNGLLKNIRVARQEKGTRLVLDLTSERKCQMVQINANTLEFRIR